MEENRSRADAAVVAAVASAAPGAAGTAAAGAGAAPRETALPAALPDPGSLSGRVSVATYDWGGEDGHLGLRLPCDVVLVSDCVLPKLYPIEPLVAALAALTRPRQGAVELPPERKGFPLVLMSYEHRVYPDFDPRVGQRAGSISTACFSRLNVPVAQLGCADSVMALPVICVSGAIRGPG